MLADPFILLEDGIYYAYGTSSKDGIVVYESTDLRVWEGPCGKAAEGLALSKEDSWGDSKFWAPEVYRTVGHYVMTYSVEEHIAVAFSDSPLGPFVQKEPFDVFTPDQNSIDSHIFIDDDGQPYLYWVRFGLGKGNEIRVAKLSEELDKIVSPQVECLSSLENTWERVVPDSKVAEGPFVMKLNGFYYLSYSCNDFRSKDYAVGYAVSESPFGPWKRNEDNPILKRPLDYVGSGHHSFFYDRSGQLCIVFHCHYSEGQVSPRRTLIAPCSLKANDEGEIKMEIDTAAIIVPVVK